MSTEKVRYITENFKKLPKDILIKLLLDLELKDAISLCNTNTYLQNECKRLNIYDTLLKRETPLAQKNYDAIDQLELLERGYSTFYIMKTDGNNKVIEDPQFRISLVVESTNDYYSVFAIAGCPPPKGTKVWLVGLFGEISEIIFGVNNLSVFSSYEEAVDFLRNDDKDTESLQHLRDIMVDTGLSRNEVVDMIIEDFTGDEPHEETEGFVFQEVILP